MSEGRERRAGGGNQVAVGSASPAPTPGKATLTGDGPPSPGLFEGVTPEWTDIDPHEVAAEGVAGSGGPLPYLDQIQRSFGRFDVSNVRAHVGGAAGAASATLGAEGYAMGNDVALGGSPSMHTTAHEAAHVVQQRSGLKVVDGVGEAGDAYERNADAVADRVVAGASAEDLLAPYAGGSPSSTVQRKVLQLDRKNPQAREYLNANEPQIVSTARKVVEQATYSTHTEQIQWWNSMQAFAALASAKIGVGSNYDVESLIRPEQITRLVDRSRQREIEPRSGAVGTKGPSAYFVAVGVEVGNACVRRISESLMRMLPRFVDARLNGKKGTPSEVVSSHPMDVLVIDALSSLTPPVLWSAQDYKPQVPRPTTPRKTTLVPEGKSGMWFRLVSPADATLEEVSKALLNDPTETFRIQDARPLFGVTNDARWGKQQDLDAATALVDGGGPLLEEIAVAEAGTAKTSRTRDQILEQMRLNAQLLRTSLREAAQKFGLGKRTEAPAQRIEARIAKLAKAGDADVVKYDRQAAAQAHLLEQAGNGLVADIARLSAYAPQFGIDLAADPGAFRLPHEYRAALREDAELWAKVLEVSDLAGGAQQHLHAASQHSMTLDIEILERSLDATRDAAHAAKGAPKTTAVMDAGTLAKREEEKRLELAKLRAQLVADPTKVDQKAANKTNDESRDLIFESQIVSNAASLEDAWKALDDVDSWVAVVSRDEPMISYLKKEGKRYTARWNKIYADFKAGKKTEARTAFEEMVAEEEFRAYLGKVQRAVTKAGKHARFVKLFATVLIMAASLGAGAVLGGVVTGALGAGTRAAMFGAETMAAIGHVTRFVGMTAAFTWLDNRAFSKDHSLKTYLGDLAKNIVLFGALEGLTAVVRASGVTKIFEVGKKVDTAQLLKKGTNDVAEAILVGGVGVAFAYVEAKVQAALKNRQLTEAQVNELVEDNVAQTIIFTVLGRLMASPLKSINIQSQYQGAKWKAAMDGWYRQRDWLSNVGQQPKLDVVASAAGRDREQAQREIDALEELKETAKKDPDALHGTGVTATSLDANLATVRTHQQRSYALEMAVSFRQLGPNTFLVPRNKIKPTLATVENGSKARVESVDASGAKTYSVPPKHASDLPLRFVEDIPLWERTASGKDVLAAARKAGVYDALHDVAPSRGEHLVKAMDAHKAGEQTVRYHLEQAGLDPKVRDAMLRIWNLDNLRKNAAVDPTATEGIVKLEQLFSKENVATIIEKIRPAELEAYLHVIQSSTMSAGKLRSAGVDFFIKLAESQKALRFARRYGLELTLNLSRRMGWAPELDAAFDAVDSRASADFDGTSSWRKDLEKADTRAKVDGLLGKAKPARAKPVRRSKKDLPVDRNPDEWETRRIALEQDLAKRGQKVTQEELELRTDCEVFFDLAKNLEFRQKSRTQKIELLDTFDRVALQSKMPSNWISAHRGVISEAFFNPQFGQRKSRFLKGQLVEGKTPEGASIPDYDIKGASFTEYVNQKSNVIDSGKKDALGVYEAGKKVAKAHLKKAIDIEQKNLPHGARYSLDYVREPNAATIAAMKRILFSDGVTVYRVKFGDTWHVNPQYKGP